MFTAFCVQYGSNIQWYDFINESWGHYYALAIKMWPEITVFWVKLYGLVDIYHWFSENCASVIRVAATV